MVWLVPAQAIIHDERPTDWGLLALLVPEGGQPGIVRSQKPLFVTTSPFGCRDYKVAADGGSYLPSQNQHAENSRKYDANERLKMAILTRQLCGPEPTLPCGGDALKRLSDTRYPAAAHRTSQVLLEGKSK